MPTAPRATRRWLGIKLRKRVVHAFCGRHYRDRDRDLGRTVIVAGCARSGTTWLADTIAAAGRGRLMFEPFHSGRVEAFAGFPRFPYLRPEQKQEGLLDFAERVLTGAIRHRWIDSHVETLSPRFRLVKEIRANLFLRWLHDRFPQVPVLFLVRHPCAVVSSRLRAGWQAEDDLRDMLSQPELVTDFLSDRLDHLDRATAPEERHAAIWCIQNLVPLSQFGSGLLPLIFYERLCLEPERELQRIARALGEVTGGSLPERMSGPSLTAARDSAVLTGEDRVESWKRHLTARQTESILRVVEIFELGFLYDAESTPDERLVSAGLRRLRS